MGWAWPGLGWCGIMLIVQLYWVRDCIVFGVVLGLVGRGWLGQWQFFAVAFWQLWDRPRPCESILQVQALVVVLYPTVYMLVVLCNKECACLSSAW